MEGQRAGGSWPGCRGAAVLPGLREPGAAGDALSSSQGWHPDAAEPRPLFPGREGMSLDRGCLT